MKNSIKHLLMALLCLYSSAIFSQSILKVNEFTPQVVFNYENQLKIVWPLEYGTWNDKPKFERLGETKSYFQRVRSMISKIKSELDGSQALTINLYLDQTFNEIKIDKQQGTTSYTFRDTLIEFNGKHLLQINDGKKWPVLIYFNNIDQLAFLDKIDFQGLQDFIEKDLNKKTLNNLQKSKELIYISNDGQLSRYGLIGRDKLNSLGFQGMAGSMVAFDHIGLGLDVQLTLLKYTKGNNNEKQLSHKMALNLKSFFWDGLPNQFNASYSSLGFDFTTNQRILGNSSVIDLVGMGIGVYSLQGNRGYNLNVFNKDPLKQTLTDNDNVTDGIYLSFIAELRKLYVSYDMHFGMKNPSETYDSFGSLTLGYKF